MFFQIVSIALKKENPFEKYYSNILLGHFNMITELFVLKKLLTRQKVHQQVWNSNSQYFVIIFFSVFKPPQVPTGISQFFKNSQSIYSMKT